MLGFEQIARTAHEVNRAYCAAMGDDSQVPWEKAPEWQKTSAMKGVGHLAHNPHARPEDSHESWLDEKIATGWVYGPIKDEKRKTHPCILPYHLLPQEQQVEDALFIATVRTLLKIQYEIV